MGVLDVVVVCFDWIYVILLTLYTFYCGMFLESVLLCL